MDDEESFARLLSQSTTAQKPSWSPAASPDDPWANPFSDEASSNPFSSPFPVASLSGPESPQAARQPASPTSPKYERSPYTLQNDDDARAVVPDPPSVIAARLGEQERGFDDGQGGFGSPTRGRRPADVFGAPASEVTPTSPPARRGLPPGLVDDDFLGTSDPSSSLKKAFVKSSPAKTTKPLEKVDKAAEPYVFTPSKKKSTAEAPQANGHEEKAKTEKPGAGKEATTSKPPPAVPKTEEKAVDKNPSSIPLPESTDITPTVSRVDSPAPPQAAPALAPEAGSSSLPTPASDRVSVSPLDAPSTEQDYGFKSLAIGASSNPALFNGNDSATSARFGGRGWGAMDEEDTGLFGKGGPSSRTTDPWSGGDQGWGETGLPSPQAGPSHLVCRLTDRSRCN